MDGIEISSVLTRESLHCILAPRLPYVLDSRNEGDLIILSRRLNLMRATIKINWHRHGAYGSMGLCVVSRIFQNILHTPTPAGLTSKVHCGIPFRIPID